MKLAIVIPAYNEEETLGIVLNSLPKKLKGIREIKTIVVDDGSKDRTHEIARWNQVMALKHIVNLGVGAATITGLEAARKINSDIVITLDADGQHSPSNIEKLIEPIIKKEVDIVIGSRDYKIKNMPVVKVFGNLMMNTLTYMVFRKWSADSQSGMKAFSKSALEKIKLHSTGYEICSEIIGEIKRNNIQYKEIKIDTIYTDYSKLRGQNILNGINILTKSLFIKIASIK
ncbi:MAG: glycosyltransferase family 2 protein [Patescibacteria group bacterium]